jgi:hypothetical protein
MEVPIGLGPMGSGRVSENVKPTEDVPVSLIVVYWMISMYVLMLLSTSMGS